jgi:hypothetical protein
VVVAAWAWFGVTGALPVMIWWWYRRPIPQPGPWRLDLARLRAARLGPWRTWVAFQGSPAVEIFTDEISAGDLARLRRTLKAQLAAG